MAPNSTQISPNSAAKLRSRALVSLALASHPTPMLSPPLALDLRLRFLETLLFGPSRSPPAAASSPSSSSPSLARRIHLVETQLKQVLEAGGGSEAVRRFVQGYALNEPLLRLPPVPASELEQLTPATKLTLVLESENEIRQLERELREVETLEGRGVAGAGHLVDHEPLKPGLEELVTRVEPLTLGYATLENRTTDLLERYNAHINTLSELFICYNDILAAAEEQVTRLEQQQNVEADIS